MIGTEYAGKTALIDGLMEWGAAHGIHFHLDDHFSIPDRQFLSEADTRVMVELPPVIKERYQRFQIFYHVHVLEDHEDCLLGGFHIEEKIYGRRYYYPDDVFPMRYLRKLESLIPHDTILLLLEARAGGDPPPDAASTAHDYPIVPPEDVESVSQGVRGRVPSLVARAEVRIDTSDLTPEQLLAAFRKQGRAATCPTAT